MALTRDQFDVIANSYNDRQLNNKIKLNRRIEEVYEKIPLIKDLDGQIGVLAGRALRPVSYTHLTLPTRDQV